jgi:hypothetical protein
MTKGRRWIWWAVVLPPCILAVLAAGIGVLRHEARADFVDGSVAALMVSSAAFADGGRMPATYTCDGSNVSPPLTIAAVPPATKSLLILVDDLDAPIGFVHWIVFNVRPETLVIPEAAASKPGQLDRALQGRTDFDQVGYGGPCPPFGTHRYLFRVYALATTLLLPEGATKPQVAAAAKHHVLAEGRITGVYHRAH